MAALKHSHAFDPTYGYTFESLLAVGAPDEPRDFEEFWMKRYMRAMTLDPVPVIQELGRPKQRWKVHELSYQSTDGVQIGGWCLTPVAGKVERVMVILHGYGGREEPDFQWEFEHTALVFPCLRGIGKSPCPPLSADPMWHVLHNIHDRDLYVHGGCVEDVWLAVSAALRLFPQAQGRVGLIGASFGGGIGALALAWDRRIEKAHFSVPSFGNHPLRLTLKTTGSGAAVQALHKKNAQAVERTLGYYDAAVAARRIQVPVHFGCALFDPMVAPPGQFAIHNAVSGEKELFVLRAGHFEYPEKDEDERAMLRNIHQFFMKS